MKIANLYGWMWILFMYFCSFPVYFFLLFGDWMIFKTLVILGFFIGWAEINKKR